MKFKYHTLQEKQENDRIIYAIVVKHIASDGPTKRMPNKKVVRKRSGMT